ncbi:hypothetical protein [Dokdonella sp.]|uniref:hypothetical protein n=1 Tax=Dokdonella sp. TaxID=2291710 RepID=UPI0031BCFBD5|nr:hypothetical protein [Dokdonella sp.]
MGRIVAAALIVGLSWLLTACSTVGQVSNLADATCATAFEDALAAILVGQGEAPADARALAARARMTLAGEQPGPRPFALAAPSGTDYHLFVAPAQPACQLRLYGRVKGFTRYTNNLTWIDARPLPACRCTP